MNPNTSPSERLRQQSFLERVGRRRSLVVGLATATVLLAACYDRGTGPNLRPAIRSGFVGDPNFGANNSSASGSYDGVIDTIFGGSAPKTTPAGVFPHPTFIQVTVSGVVTNVPGALPGDGFAHEPYYTAGNNLFYGVIGFNAPNGLWWAPTAVSTLRMQGDLYPFRNYAGGQPYGEVAIAG